MMFWRAVKVFMRRNLTGVRSGPSYAGALSSAVVDEGTGSVTDVNWGWLRSRYSFWNFSWFFHDLLLLPVAVCWSEVGVYDVEVEDEDDEE